VRGLSGIDSFTHKAEHTLKHILVKLSLFDSRCTARCTVRQSLHLLWDAHVALTCAFAAFRTIACGAVKPAKPASPGSESSVDAGCGEALCPYRSPALFLSSAEGRSTLLRDGRLGEAQFDVVDLVVSVATAAFCSLLCRELCKLSLRVRILRYSTIYAAGPATGPRSHANKFWC